MTDTPSIDDTLAVAQLGALAQTTRFRVFRLLMRAGESGLPAGKIAQELDVPQNTLSAHLNVLSSARLISARRDGRSLIYSVRLETTKALIGYLVNDCCDGHPEICAMSVDGKGC